MARTDTRPTDLDHEFTHGFTVRFAQWKAKQLIRHGGFRKDEREDLVQEFLLAVVAAVDDYDEEAGDWMSFVATVVERRAGRVHRDRNWPKRNPDEPVLSLDVLVDDEDGHQVPLGHLVGDRHREALTGRQAVDVFERVDLEVDLHERLRCLPDDLLEVCRLLATGTQRDAADALGITRRALRYRLNKIREHIQSGGNLRNHEKGAAQNGSDWKAER